MAVIVSVCASSSSFFSFFRVLCSGMSVFQQHWINFVGIAAVGVVVETVAPPEAEQADRLPVGDSVGSFC